MLIPKDLGAGSYRRRDLSRAVPVSGQAAATEIIGGSFDRSSRS
jgi:hypothetical protein